MRVPKVEGQAALHPLLMHSQLHAVPATPQPGYAHGSSLHLAHGAESAPASWQGQPLGGLFGSHGGGAAGEGPVSARQTEHGAAGSGGAACMDASGGPRLPCGGDMASIFNTGEGMSPLGDIDVPEDFLAALNGEGHGLPGLPMGASSAFRSGTGSELMDLLGGEEAVSAVR